MESIKPPLTRGIKVSYGIGQAAEGIKTAAFNVFVFFYYTQVLGLPTAYTGIAIGIALAVDSITDPVIGSLSDNWQGTKGRRHPFIFASWPRVYWAFQPAGSGRICAVFVAYSFFCEHPSLDDSLLCSPHLIGG